MAVDRLRRLGVHRIDLAKRHDLALGDLHRRLRTTTSLPRCMAAASASPEAYSQPRLSGSSPVHRRRTFWTERFRLFFLGRVLPDRVDQLAGAARAVEPKVNESSVPALTCPSCSSSPIE